LIGYQTSFGRQLTLVAHQPKERAQSS